MPFKIEIPSELTEALKKFVEELKRMNDLEERKQMNTPFMPFTPYVPQQPVPFYPTNPLPYTPQYPIYDCGCPLNTICNNTACPRRIQVTYSNTQLTNEVKNETRP